MIGWPYFHGIGANRSLPPSTYDSPPAIALREAGAVIFAKTTMPDCGLLASGISSLHGITRNHGGCPGIPADRQRAPGPRSPRVPDSFRSGRTIAGSVRLPAAHCGLASLKPTHGRVPHLRPIPCAWPDPWGAASTISPPADGIGRQDERDTWSLRRTACDITKARSGCQGTEDRHPDRHGLWIKPEAEVRNAVEVPDDCLPASAPSSSRSSRRSTTTPMRPSTFFSRCRLSRI